MVEMKNVNLGEIITFKNGILIFRRLLRLSRKKLVYLK